MTDYKRFIGGISGNHNSPQRLKECFDNGFLHFLADESQKHTYIFVSPTKINVPYFQSRSAVRNGKHAGVK